MLRGRRIGVAPPDPGQRDTAKREPGQHQARD
jgi:hypothetical protein